ncbi:uncharacterized protein LOC115702384 [Cannabis sativa]|nr:uncharacterized protein LOC115702384 [Cannabis sativa]
MAATVVDFADEGDQLMMYLPSQVLDEACDTKTHFVKPLQLHSHRNRYHHHHHLHHDRRHAVVKFPVEELPDKNSIKSNNKKPPQRPKLGQHWASAAGHGMRAIFLDSAQKSCIGTGVFLPQISHNNKKPACAPVLLPSRVVQALNLNVQALGLQISPRQADPKANRKSGSHNNNTNSGKHSKKTKEVTIPSSQCGVISQKRNSSPELFLPKEWTY